MLIRLMLFCLLNKYTANRIRIGTHRLEDERSTINLWPFFYYKHVIIKIETGNGFPLLSTGHEPVMLTITPIRILYNIQF